MALRTWHTLTLDTAEETYPARVTLVENSDNGFEIDLRERGEELDLSEVRDIFLITQPPKKGEASVISTGTITGTSQVSVELGRSEVAFPGEADAQLKLMDADGNTISTLRFEFNVQKDVDDGSVPSNDEKTFFQQAISDIYTSRDDAQRAADDADTARTQLTGEVGQALQTLSNDKAAALQEVDAALDGLETDKNAALTEMDTRTDDALANLESEKNAALTEMDTRTDAAIDEMQAETRSNIQALHTDKDAAISQMEDRTGAAIQDLETDKDDALGQLSSVLEANRINRLPAVETVAERDSTYPNPTQGDTVRVTSEARTYSFEDGAWIITDANHPTAIEEAVRQLEDGGAAEEPIIHGANLIESEFDSPADVEIRGTTLVSLGNSNLEKGKYYALTDEKYKVITDGKTVGGVGKFQKGETHRTTADFKGKVNTSTTENPHLIRYDWGQQSGDPVNVNSLDQFTVNAVEGATIRPSHVQNLDGSVGYLSKNQDGWRAHLAFSFNLVEHIERNLGIIPGDTLANKVAWVRENLSTAVMAFYGYGTGPNGNNVQLYRWSGSWSSSGSRGSHQNPTATRIDTSTSSDYGNYVSDTGYFNVLAAADPSDGITSSMLYVDYVALDIDLKSTAQLNTRPTIVRVENFEGKVAGSTVENPHTSWRTYGGVGGHAGYLEPGNFPTELDDNRYSAIMKTDDRFNELSNNGEGQRAQQLFTFDLVRAIEENIGEIPLPTLEEKKEWVRNNVSSFIFRWNGLGSGPEGYYAGVRCWYPANPPRYSGYYRDNTTSEFKDVLWSNIIAQASAANYVRDGKLHFLAYGPTSDGNSYSVLRTNYAELEITLKPTADFRQPRIPLYEVSKEEYDRIGVSQTDAATKRRYPVVEGVQHLVNPYVESAGENLLPPFTDPRWEIHKDAEVIGPHELSLRVYDKGWNKHSSLSIPVMGGQTYTLSGDEGYLQVVIYDKSGSTVFNDYLMRSPKTFTVPSNGTTLRVRATNGSVEDNRTWTFKNPMLTLGTEPKPFTPYNPSTLHAPVTLSAVGDKRDVLYQQDGRWYVRRTVREVDFTGELDWKAGTSFNNYDVVYVVEYSGLTNRTGYSLTNHRGAELKYAAVGGTSLFVAGDTVSTIVSSMMLSAFKSDTGFPAGYSVRNSDWKRYFNGWKYTDGTTWESVTGNGQTATLEEALTTMPDDYTPYKLTYVLAEPEVIDVTDLVDGDLIINENALLEVGSGFTYTEDDEGTRTYTYTPASDRATVTANVNDAIVRIQRSLRSAFDALNRKVQDRAEDTILLKRQMLNVLVRLDAVEGRVTTVEGRVDVLETPPEPEGGV